MALWDDAGPASQGKILTAILQDDIGKARVLLRRWSPGDLRTLNVAANALQVLIRKEEARRGVQ